jgi:geranylgeranyl reductase family protein
LAAIHIPRADVLVVGAGPAGSWLAGLLAKRGLDVMIIDKERFPREKICGGGLSRKAVELLDCDLSAVTQRRIRGAYLTYGNDATLVKDIDPPIGITVVRRDFDRFLLDRACAAGARFHAATSFRNAQEHPDRIEIDTSAGRFAARLLLGADGAASAVRRKIFGGAAVRSVPALEALVPATREVLAQLDDRVVFDFAGVPGGYGWIFPKQDHLNVGIYSPWNKASLHDHLDRFLARYACLRGRTARRVGSAIPIGNRDGRFQQGRTWLLGDAAGLAEALFGEGIYFALKSAELAARAIAEDGPEPGSSRYSNLLYESLIPELQAARRMAAVLYRFPRFAFTHWVINERINGNFAGLISGDCGYRQCLRQTLMMPHHWLLSGVAPGTALRL